MLKHISSSGLMRILKWDVGAPIKRVLTFDVNRILFADLDQLLQRPVPQVVAKAILGWIAAVMVTGVTAMVVFAVVTPAIERLQAFVSLGLVAAWVAPDVRRLFRTRSAQ